MASSVRVCAIDNRFKNSSAIMHRCLFYNTVKYVTTRSLWAIRILGPDILTLCRVKQLKHDFVLFHQTDNCYNRQSDY